MKVDKAVITKYVVDLINGTEKNPLQQGLVYKNLKETNGNNRSPDLDKMILRQGGRLGEPYCLYIQQDILDCIRLKFNCIIRLSEGGGTQDFFDSTSDMYISEKPLPLSIGIYQNKDDEEKGHAVLCLSYMNSHNEFTTFEGNTSSDNHDVVRDGEGCYFKSRKLDYPSKRIRGFIDIYSAIRFKD